MELMVINITTRKVILTMHINPRIFSRKSWTLFDILFSIHGLSIISIIASNAKKEIATQINTSAIKLSRHLSLPLHNIQPYAKTHKNATMPTKIEKETERSSYILTMITPP